MNSSSRAIGETLPLKTRLHREQIIGFWAAWSGWTLDGMDSVIFALVLVPALKELLPLSGFAATPGVIGLAGSLMFALFLVGWGFCYIWGPLADRFGRVRVLAATTLFYAVFTGLAAISHNVWELAIFRFLAGVGVGGEWALAGTYVAEAWPEDRRRAGAGISSNGLLRGIFSRLGAQLHHRHALWLACHVPVRLTARRGRALHPAQGPRTAQMETHAWRRTRFGAKQAALARYLLEALSATNHR